MTPGKTVAYHTLGCKLNFSETSSIRRALHDVGYQTVSFKQPADVYVINTCSVTDNADKKCRAAVRRAKSLNEHAHIAVIGCYAQLKPEEIEQIPGVSLVLGAGEKFNLDTHLTLLEEDTTYDVVHAGRIRDVKTFHPAYSIGDRTRTFLKVQDGCDYFCSFCTIPMARGRSRSAPISTVVDQAKEIAEQGVKEVVLTGVNIGDFGRSPDGLQRTEETFLDLVEQLDAVDGIERFRISSIEPNLLSQAIIDFVAQSKRFMPHFHIPLQSGSDKMLKLMRRKYDTALYRERIERIYQTMPDACVGIDVICGFRGEEEKDFLDTHTFLRSLNPAYLHVFTYSERDNTKGLNIKPVVPMKERKERSKALRILSRKCKHQFYKPFVGTERTVLWEDHNKDGFMSGYTDNYIPVSAPYDPMAVGKLEQVTITSLNGLQPIVERPAQKQLS